MYDVMIESKKVSRDVIHGCSAMIDSPFWVHVIKAGSSDVTHIDCTHEGTQCFIYWDGAVVIQGKWFKKKFRNIDLLDVSARESSSYRCEQCLCHPDLSEMCVYNGRLLCGCCAGTEAADDMQARQERALDAYLSELEEGY